MKMRRCEPARRNASWDGADGETADKLPELAKNDSEKTVRVAAIKSLGWYINFGEENMYEDYEVGDSPTGEWIEEEVTVEQYQAIRAAGKCGVDEARPILREIAATTVERGEGEQAVMALARLGHTESFLFLDELESNMLLEVTADFAEYAMNEWMFYKRIRKDL